MPLQCPDARVVVLQLNLCSPLRTHSSACICSCLCLEGVLCLLPSGCGAACCLQFITSGYFFRPLAFLHRCTFGVQPAVLCCCILQHHPRGTTFEKREDEPMVESGITSTSPLPLNVTSGTRHNYYYRTFSLLQHYCIVEPI